MTDAYKNALDLDGRNLTNLARRDALPETDGRQTEVAEVATLLRAGHCVLLVGPSGVGKSAIIRGLATEFATSSGPDIIELSTTSMLSGTKYLGEWQSKVTQIVKKAKQTSSILYVLDVWNLPFAGRTSNAETNVLDALRPHLQAGDVVLLAEVTVEVLRQMERISSFVSLFHRFDVRPLDEADVDQCIANAATRAGLDLPEPTRRGLVALTRRFLPARPQPGPSLDVIAHLRDAWQSDEAPTREDIEGFFARMVGLPDFIVSHSVTRSAATIRAWFEDRIVGQREAIEAIVEVIALFKAGMQDPDRPMGTLLFVGPTGVGKTEVARALATYLFGNASRLLRFDLSEFKDFHAFELLLGNPRDPSRPARLIDPVRAQPFQIVLFDELEKAHANVWDILLPLLDEGRLTPPGGNPVDFRNTIVIATSNVGALQADKAVGFGAGDTGARRQRIRRALEQAFRPEFLNRFQHTVVFHPLDRDHARQIAKQEIRRIVGRQGIADRNLVVEVDDSALDLLVDQGFDQRYGARALKRVLQRRLALKLAMALMERAVPPGSLLKVVRDRETRLKVKIIDTEHSHDETRATTRGPKRRSATSPAELKEAAAILAQRIEEIAGHVDEEGLAAQRVELEKRRRHRDFWRDQGAAAEALAELDRNSRVLRRIDRLRTRSSDLTHRLDDVDTDRSLRAAADHAASLGDAVDVAHRELVVFGPSGLWDALVHVDPVGGELSTHGRDTLVEAYQGWAKHSKMTCTWLHEPRDGTGPAVFTVEGRYATGLLAGERGLHRFRRDGDTGLVRIRIAAWTQRRGEVTLGTHRALRAVGVYGGTLRSRLDAGDLVLQNGRNLAANRMLAAQVVPSWQAGPPPSDEVVRHYDLGRGRIRDVLTGFTTGKRDALSPHSLHQLLVRRAEPSD